MFQLNPVSHNYDVKTRSREKYFVTLARTERLKSSAIPYMQRLINAESKYQETDWIKLNLVLVKSEICCKTKSL